MHPSVFDIFKPGIGPSSSHTVGPMVAARRFLDLLIAAGHLPAVARLRVRLHGSLALTGKGHATDVAVILGLCGAVPESVDPDRVPEILEQVRSSGQLPLDGQRNIPFAEATDLEFYPELLPAHANGLVFLALDAAGDALLSETFYSVGGGFVATAQQMEQGMSATETPVPHPFTSAAEMLAMADGRGLSIAGLMMENELARRSRDQIVEGLRQLRDIMRACVDRGLRQEGILPGGLNVRRRARALHQRLLADATRNSQSPQIAMQWVSLYAIAVNEENAAGGRVVTAPTNGAAGVVPAVLRYYEQFCPDPTEEGLLDFLLTAAAVAILIKRNASISGAEVGCQGEVGSACAMAAAGLAAALGGSNAQVENAAEIGLEHNLGLTCDPIGGLVQIPCIERNAMGAVKAVNAAYLAMNSDGQHMVSLDAVIETMRRTGRDMNPRYKETSQGGLAETMAVSVNLPEC